MIGTIIGALGATGRRITNRVGRRYAYQRAEPLHGCLTVCAAMRFASGEAYVVVPNKCWHNTII